MTRADDHRPWYGKVVVAMGVLGVAVITLLVMAMLVMVLLVGISRLAALL